MRNKIFKMVLAVCMIVCIMGTTVFADEVTDLKNEKSQKERELSEKENELAYIVVQLDELELSMANLTEEIESVESDLAEAEVKLSKQYDDMKLRIKYMYEDQSATISDAIFSAEDMGEVLNKTEYVQRVYDYDRTKLDEMSATAKEIENLNNKLLEDKASFEAMANELTSKKAILYTSIESLKNEVSDYNSRIQKAVEKAAQAQWSYSGTAVPNNNSAIANAVVSDAFKYLGVPYVYGGASPSGFDCSGLTSYLFKQYGISLPRTSAGQAYGGYNVGSLANAQPGDVICYPGHVALYIGNGKVIHAPYTGTVVKVADATMMTIIAIRRYW